VRIGHRPPALIHRLDVCLRHEALLPAQHRGAPALGVTDAGQQLQHGTGGARELALVARLKVEEDARAERLAADLLQVIRRE